MKIYIEIQGATLCAKRLIESFWWNDSDIKVLKDSASTLDDPRYNISIIGGFKLEMRDDDSRLRIAPIKTNLGWAPLDKDMYWTIEIGYTGVDL